MWNNLLNLDNLWNLNYFFLNSFNFIDFWNCVSLFYNFFDYLLSCYNFLYDALYWDNFLNNPFDLFNLFSYVWYFLYNFSILNVVNNFLLDSWNLFNLNSLLFNSNDFLENLWNLNNLFNDFSNWYYFLYNFFHWDWYLNWNNYLSFNLNYFRIFNC